MRAINFFNTNFHIQSLVTKLLKLHVSLSAVHMKHMDLGSWYFLPPTQTLRTPHAHFALLIKT